MPIVVCKDSDILLTAIPHSDDFSSASLTPNGLPRQSHTENTKMTDNAIEVSIPCYALSDVALAHIVP